MEDEFEAISMAMTDSLTGIPNRRGFYRAGEKLFRDEPAGCVVQPHLFRSGQVQTGERSLGTRAEGDEVLKVLPAFTSAPRTG